MEYEVVELQEKTVVGVEARTNNYAADMGIVIGGLWKRFFGGGIYQAIDHKVNDKSMAIYTDYAGDEKDDYTVVVACETFLKRQEQIDGRNDGRYDGRNDGRYDDRNDERNDDRNDDRMDESNDSNDGSNQVSNPPTGTVIRTIPAGRYAKFIVKGNQKTAISKFWSELWTMKLNRSFECDFEEYQNGDFEHAIVHIYIGLAE